MKISPYGCRLLLYFSIYNCGQICMCFYVKRDNSPSIVDNSESVWTHVSAASQRCSVSYLLPLVYLVKHILLVIWLVYETFLVVSAYFKPVLGICRSKGDGSWEGRSLAGQGHRSSRLYILTLHQSMWSTEDTALITSELCKPFNYWLMFCKQFSLENTKPHWSCVWVASSLEQVPMCLGNTASG